jgi:hypothetical protein
MICDSEHISLSFLRTALVQYYKAFPECDKRRVKNKGQDGNDNRFFK